MARDLYLELRMIEERGRRLKIARRKGFLNIFNLARAAGTQPPHREQPELSGG